MERRRFLTVACTALPLAVAGCSTDLGSSSGDSEPSRTTPTTTPPFDRAEEIAIVVSNARPDTVTVSLTVTRDSDPIFEDTLAVDPDGRRTVDPGIDDLGDYELTVTLADGAERVRPFDIESYDRRMGSNLIVEIDDDIMVLMEE